LKILELLDAQALGFLERQHLQNHIDIGFLIVGFKHGWAIPFSELLKFSDVNLRWF
jgi:hypothetical protein